MGLPLIRIPLDGVESESVIARIHEEDTWYRPICPDGISCVSDVFRILEHWRGKGSLLFRGEPAPFEYPCMPRIARSMGSFTPVEEGKRLTTEEVEEVRKAEGDFQAGAIADPDVEAFEGPLEPDDPYWLPLSQHYGYATRLLDVTEDPRVALYFAAQPALDGFDPDVDGYVFWFFRHSFCPQRRPIEEIPDTAIEIPWPDRLGDVFETSPGHPIEVRDHTGYLLQPPTRNTRQREQRGSFLWWHPICARLPGQIVPLKVRAEGKAEILKELEEQNLSRRELFPV
ncbi:FRG domain-containing protein [Acidobacteria bacterium AH-259-D05]|nr:FRG domain-containing protein [Acidobacteria bacterium AH-259-D05]